MAYDVRFTHDAERDLDEIYSYIARFQSPERAEQVLDQILEIADSLSMFPDKGPFPAELSDLGMRAFRQAVSWPYRLIYRVEGRRVMILLIADGWRNMQSLLAQRLLSG